MSNLDQDIVNLAKAIRQVESGGNYKAVGDAGTSTGAYQFQKDSWNQWASEYLGDAKAPQTKQNQNQVAYYRIKALKDKGYNAAEIAAAWNAGEGRLKNDQWKTWKGTTKINGQDIAYDTPGYVEKVRKAYQTFKTPTEQPAPTQSKYDFLNTPVPEANVGPVDKTERLASLGKGIADIVVDPFRQLGSASANMFRDEQNDVKSYENFSGDQVNVPGYKDGQAQGAVDTAIQVGGAGLGVASTVVPFLKGAKVLEAMKGGSVLLPTGLGYAQDVSDNIKTGDTSIGALTPGLNTAVGGGIGIFSKGLNTLTTPIKDAREKAFTEGIEGLRNRTKTTENAFNNNTIVRKTDAGEQTITPVDTWFKHDAPIPTVKTEGGTAAVDASAAAQHFTDLIKKSDDSLIESLEKEGVKFSTAQVKQIANEIVKNTDNVAGIANGKTTRAEVADMLTKRIDNLATEHGNEWSGPAVRAVLKGANADFKDEVTKDVSRLLGDTMRELMYNYTARGREELANMQELLSARNFAETINGKKVAGGGSGRIASRFLGTVIGSSLKLPFGIGEILGAVGGDKAAQVFQKATFMSIPAEAKAKILKLMKAEGSSAAEIQAAEKAIKVKSVGGENKIPIKPSDDYYPPDSKLPTIDMGPKAQSKYNRPDPTLPTAEGAPKVAGELAPDSYMQEAYKKDADLPNIAYAGAPFGLAGLMDKIKNMGKETYTREEQPTEVTPPAVVESYKDKYGEVKKLDNGATVRDAGPYKDAIAAAYKAYPSLPKGFLEAMLMKESSMGTQGQDNNNPGEYGWLVALTKNTVKDIKAKSLIDKRYRELASKLDFDTPQDAIMSAAAYAAFRQRQYSDADNYTLINDPVALYMDRYHAAPSTGKMAEKADTFKKYLDYYSQV